MEKNDIQALLDAYFTGKMTPEEQAIFQNEVKQDADLRAAFSARADEITDLAIQHAGEQALRDRIRRLREERPPLPEPKLTLLDHLSIIGRRPGGMLVAAAAVVLPLIAIAINILLPSREDLIDTYYQKPYVPLTAGAVQKDTVYIAYSFYHNGVKTSSSAFVDSLRNLCPDVCIATYYRAHLNLQGKHYTEAQVDFGQIISKVI
jgi:hypothetical protein